MAAMIESSSVVAVAIRSPDSLEAVARASFRKSTASAYSSREIRRPLSSTPFRYSSTATLTMFATRRAGDSCATRRFGNPSPTEVRSAAATRPSLSLKLIAEGIYRDSSRRCRPMPGKGLPLDDDDRNRRRFAVGERHEGADRSELLEPLSGRTVEAQFRRSVVVARQNLDVAPPNAGGELVSRQCLVRRFFRGETDGQVLRRRRFRCQVRQLVRTEEPLQHSVTFFRIA